MKRNATIPTPMMGMATNAGANHLAPRRFPIISATAANTPQAEAAPRIPPRERVNQTAANPAMAIKAHMTRVGRACRPKSAIAPTNIEEMIR